MTTIPDKEVVRVLNESLIPLTAREIAVNLGYPDPNNAIMCTMRRKLASLRKYNMVTLAGFSKRDLGGYLAKTWATPDRIQDVRIWTCILDTTKKPSGRNLTEVYVSRW